MRIRSAGPSLWFCLINGLLVGYRPSSVPPLFLVPLHLSHLFPVPRRCGGPAAISPHGLRNFGKLRSNSRLRLDAEAATTGRGAQRRIRGFYERTVVIGPRYDFLAIIEKAIKEELHGNYVSGGSHAVKMTRQILRTCLESNEFYVIENKRIPVLNILIWRDIFVSFVENKKDTIKLYSKIILHSRIKIIASQCIISLFTVIIITLPLIRKS